MSFLDTFSYFSALVAIAIAPGPLMLLLVTRAASDDIRGAVGFAIGTALGSLTIVSLVCIGMNAWLSEVPEVLDISKYLMLAYILWIAYGMWSKGFALNSAKATTKSGFALAALAGFTTCVLSPYMLVLFPLVLPEVMDITNIVMPDFLVITFTTFLAEAVAAGLMIGLAAQLRRLGRDPRKMQIMNRTLAGVLALGGSWMALA